MKTIFTSCLSFLLMVLAVSAGDVITSLEPGFELKVFAEAPEITTPTGIAVDGNGRVFVIESHTHQTPSDYNGPTSDLVKVLEDRNHDGRADEISVFASGFRFGMSLAFSKSGELYLVQRDRVLIISDANGKGLEVPKAVLRLETAGQYPHNGLDGIAFSPDGWLYIGMGENLGEKYTLTGVDGATQQGGGEGGNIFRCRPDGSKLERYATGFWNPFGLAFDEMGRLFAVDNDPDGRPPCRLLHVIQGGDFGYKFKYGRSGLHPFVAWEGELPGTLSMVAGTGEAPSGILVCSLAKWPARYRNTLLVTTWGDNTLESYDLQAEGASFKSRMKIFAKGDLSFRPVAFTSASNGETYFTDWGDKSYPVHKKGRIWKLTPELKEKAAEVSAAPLSPTEIRLKITTSFDAPEAYPALLNALKESDPYIRSSAIFALQRPVYRGEVERDAFHPEAAVRLGLELVLRRLKASHPENYLSNYLKDPVEGIRRMALIWAAEEGVGQMREQIGATLEGGPVSPELFATYIAAAEMLNPEFKKEARSIWSGGDTPVELLNRTLKNPTASPQVKALALAMSPATNKVSMDMVKEYLVSPTPELQFQAIQYLGGNLDAGNLALLKETVKNKEVSGELRADALAAAGPRLDAAFLTSMTSEEEPVETTAWRGLRSFGSEAGVRERVEARLKKAAPGSKTAESLKFILEGAGEPRPDDFWRATLNGEGNGRAGRRLFFDSNVSCSKCHRAQGRGGNVGPDLSVIGRSMDREKLVDSILNPSANIGPEFVTHEIETKEGVLSGVARARTAEGITLGQADGTLKMIPGGEIIADRVSGVSTMPDGLEQSLSVGDFRDLVAFLLSLK